MSNVMKGRKPNFFIAGAPKCGTSAMQQYLGEHPNIFMSHPKEPHYFSMDFPKIRLYQTEDQYLELFSSVSGEHHVIGEASPTYLYSRVALEKIYEFNQAAKVLVMLRNPVEMVQSLHQQLVFNGDEDVEDLATAWELQDIRTRGKSIPTTCLEPAFLQYRDYATYGVQVERLFRVFPRKSVMVVIFDDFRADPAKIYAEVLEFLAVPHDGRTEFPTVNPRKNYRYRWLAALLQYFRVHRVKIRQSMSTIRKIKEWLGIEHFSLLKILEQSNSKRIERPSISPVLENKLKEAFRDDVEHLSRLLNRDLSFWTNQT